MTSAEYPVRMLSSFSSNRLQSSASVGFTIGLFLSFPLTRADR